MKKISKGLIALGIIVLAVVCMYSCTVSKYNSIVNLDEQISSQWAQVESQYQRRYDLIPNLVATVQGYAKHESDVFTEVAEQRSKAGGVITLDESILEDEEKLAQFQKVQESLGQSLQRLLSVTESYPELKANQNFIALQDELEGTENRISVERKKYNESVQVYNKAIRQFPTVLLANIYGFKTKAYFKASQEAQTAPVVKF